MTKIEKEGWESAYYLHQLPCHCQCPYLDPDGMRAWRVGHDRGIAERAGWDAFENGVARDDCPYHEPHTKKSWLEGWDHAEWSDECDRQEMREQEAEAESR